VAVLASGKVLVVGATQAGFAVFRLLPSGALDATWGSNGLVTTQLGITGFYSAVALQPDGKIVATGRVQPSDPRADDFAVARYLDDGGLDPTFGDGGVSTTDFGPPASQADIPVSIQLQADGRILVGGYTETNGVVATENFAVARYNVDGSLDTTFGSNGKVVVDVPGTADAPGVIALAPGGKVLVGGASAASTSVSARFDVTAVRLNGDGTLDTSFADAGVFVAGFGTNVNSPIRAVAVDGTSRTTLAGRLSNPAQGPDFAAVRLDPTGTLDPTFADGGVVTTDLGSGESAHSALLQPDGKLLLVGTRGNDRYERGIGLVRYKSDGSLDPTFGIGGIVLTPPPANSDLGADTAALAPCTVVTAGVWVYKDGAVDRTAIGLSRFHR